jgi:hypothetical protein
MCHGLYNTHVNTMLLNYKENFFFFFTEYSHFVITHSFNELYLSLEQNQENILLYAVCVIKRLDVNMLCTFAGLYICCQNYVLPMQHTLILSCYVLPVQCREMAVYFFSVPSCTSLFLLYCSCCCCLCSLFV